MSQKALIIPAAGSGTRMQKEIPKPYLSIAGRPILEHTIRRLLPLEGLCQVVIATSGAYLKTARELLDKMRPNGTDDLCVAGGDNRQQSIYNALQKIVEVDLVLVHDAVRPFAPLLQVRQCCREAEKSGAAILGVPARDTVKKVDEQHFIQETPERKYLWKSQTPQVFQRKVLLQAYEQAREEQFVGTDDASLVERMGQRVKMVKGSQANIKLTYPLDLKMAKVLMEESA